MGVMRHGNNPAFLLKTNRARMPSGWCLLSFHVGEASTTLAPVLFIDRGNGFSDATALGLPPVRTGWVHQLILLRPDLKALRLNPTIGPAVPAGRGNGPRDRQAAGPVAADLALRLALAGGCSATCDGRLDGDEADAVDGCWPSAPGKVRDLDRDVRYATPGRPAAIRANAEALSYKPLVSVVMPVSGTSIEFLRQALDSVLDNSIPIGSCVSLTIARPIRRSAAS